MKQQILDRIKALGGNIDQVKCESCIDDIRSITFNTVLYEYPEDTSWAKADEQEPIYGLGDYITQHQAELDADPQAFYQQLIQAYYQLTEDGRGQTFWQAELFTPFKVGTADFDKWNSDFIANDIDLKEVRKFTKDTKPDFIRLVYRYGFPDQYYVCLSDPHPENPTLWGTDHEMFFTEVTHEGSLESFLNRCITPDELVQIVKLKMSV